jgi:hypothetical protein
MEYYVQEKMHIPKNAKVVTKEEADEQIRKFRKCEVIINFVTVREMNKILKGEKHVSDV